MIYPIMPIKTLDLPLKNSKNPLFTLYAPIIPREFQYSFSTPVLHVKEALPDILLPKLGIDLNETNHYQIPKFHKNQREFLGTFHQCTPYHKLA
jgi:hypothetical protein